MSTYKPDPSSFTSSSTVCVHVEEWGDDADVYDIHQEYHIHLALLKGQPNYLTDRLEKGENNRITVTVDSVSDFGLFVTWLYTGDMPEHDLRRKLISLLRLATYLQMDTFKTYIKAKGKQCLRESDYFSAVQNLSVDTFITYSGIHGITYSEIHEYILQGLADKIVTDGWASFIAKTEGGWEDFMSREDDEDGTKGKFLSSLMARLDRRHRSSMQH